MSETALQILLLLYAANGFIAIAGYIPQVIRLYKSEQKPDNFSIPGWSLWVWTTLIAFSYASFINGDKIFMLVSGMYFLGTLAIWSLVMIRSFKHDPEPNSPNPVQHD